MATGINLIVLVQSSLMGREGAGKCTVKTGVTDSREKEEKKD